MYVSSFPPPVLLRSYVHSLFGHYICKKLEEEIAYFIVKICKYF